MKKLFFLLPALLLLACGNTEPTNNPQPQAETPKALQDNNSSDLKTYGGRSGNIVDQLYSELVDKNKVLQKLEEDLVNLNENIRDKKIRLMLLTQNQTVTILLHYAMQTGLPTVA